ncbi:phosphoribosyl-AMP cyclohydrolase / phosphoribosyl-ATP pyrophosphohydrolase [Candidatus Vidania fulgoroideae]|nr:phosphoribosyl-AMP cyclohydrolase / phosphoribosyl-ATP pyrophosphohydrolase [Candidatus Vidania fulgoroideae]
MSKIKIFPIIVQDNDTKEVLMLAWGEKKTIEKTKKNGYSYFFSRSRKKIWIKGEKSGNYQIIKEIRKDCDNDCFLYIVDQVNKITCHKNKKSCFYKNV